MSKPIASVPATVPDDLTHYMEATSRLRAFAERVEAMAETALRVRAEHGWIEPRGPAGTQVDLERLRDFAHAALTGEDAA
jgi:hypothetical protein